MKVKLTLDENNFAIREINLYYSDNRNSKYESCIKSTLNKLENNVCELDQLLVTDKCENIIIKKLYLVFIEKLSLEKQTNATGILGVKKAHFTDGTRWFYKDLIKKEFYPSFPIFADTLEDLMKKVNKSNSFWYIFDGDKVKSQNNKFNKKRNYSDAVKLQTGININSKNHSDLIKKEKDNDKKAKKVDDMLDPDYYDNYKKDKHKFFR